MGVQALQVEYRKLDELGPYPNNARMHTDEQMARKEAA